MSGCATKRLLLEFMASLRPYNDEQPLSTPVDFNEEEIEQIR